MKCRLFLSSILSFFCLSAGINQSFALTLKESFEAALKTNQSDNINQSLINQSVEQKKENEGNFLPKLSVKGTYLKQDQINPDQKTIGLNLAHSLYRGGRDSFLLKSSEKNIVIAENQKTADSFSLYLNVIQAYYNYFLNFNDYKNLELLTKQSKERVDETKKRAQIGRSRRGELLQAEAQLASADAQLFNGNGLVKESEERFYLVTGLDGKNKKNTILNEEIKIPVESHNVQFYLEAAYHRSDVKNKELKIEQAEIELSSTKTQYYPTVDVNSNYYLNKRDTAVLKNSNWDIGLTLSFPIYDGGTTSAKVNESIQKKEQAIYTLADYKANVQQEIVSKYETYHRFLDQMKAFEQAFEKAQKSYEVAIQDYRLGLISNLDVLSSLNLYLDSKRNNEKIKIQAMMYLKILEATAGILQ